MNDKFFEISKEKQDRIINGALRIFSMYDYKHATTDEIVREASISKGLLFHYFENKLGTYQFIYEYSVRYILLEMGSCLRRQEPDMFVFLRQLEFSKLYIARRYPYMLHFLNRALYENSEEAMEAIKGKREELLAFYDTISQKIDREMLPQRADRQKWNRIMNVTINGLRTEHILGGTYQPDQLYEETITYIDMMEQLLTNS